jgi:hypothetical protein
MTKLILDEFNPFKPTAPDPVPETKPRIMYEFTRNIIPGERGYYGDRVIIAGERVYKFTGNHYGAGPLPGGLLVSEHGSLLYPFFEVPLDSVRPYIS